MKLKEGIAFNYIGEETIIINPEKDVIFCLNDKGTKLWKILIDDNTDNIPKDFLDTLSYFGIFENEVKEVKNIDIYVKWTEKFSPVTFGRSCGLLPAQGGPCLGYPYQ